MQRVVGIDFGTSTTLIAHRTSEGQVSVINLGSTTRWLPSVVGLAESGELVVGEDALALPIDRIVTSIKSRLTAGETEVMTPYGPIDVVEAITALLREAKNRAEAEVPQLFKGAEVYFGCPALWTGTERRRLADIAASLGLKVDIGQIIDEPVAAGLSWLDEMWLRGASRPSGKAVIFDAGGGTLDVAYLDVAGSDKPEMTVLSAEGSPESGDRLDESIANDLRLQVSEKMADAIERLLKVRSREFKEVLSTEVSRVAPLGGGYKTVLTYGRKDLEGAFAGQLQRAKRLVDSTIRGSLLRVAQPLSPSEIRGETWESIASEVKYGVLVGGLSYVPSVADEITRMFPKAEVLRVSAPQESVARGLAEGDRLAQLNLPRPPVDICVAFEGLSREPSPEWLEENRVIYRAFTPLYMSDQVARGESPLGKSIQIPLPPGETGSYRILLSCQFPDRKRQPVLLRIHKSKSKSEETTAVSGVHDGQRPAWIKLYTNGDLVFVTSKTKSMFRVDKWPNLRGLRHDYQREIDLLDLNENWDLTYAEAWRAK
jgi:actin-like ATPase involved in cell morphogenesis